MIWWMALGSALGGVARYSSVIWVSRIFGWQFPWGTLFVNLLGSLIIGLVANLPVSDKGAWIQQSREVLMLGVLGGFTTFSSFSLQTLHLLHQRSVSLALANAVASVVLCVAAAALGSALAQGFNR